MVPMTWIAAGLTFAWPYARSQSSLIAIAVLYGLSNAAFVSSFNMPLYDMGEMGDVGRRIGTVMMFSAVGALVGPPISGAILNKTGGLEAVSYYAGEFRVLPCLVFFPFVLEFVDCLSTLPRRTYCTMANSVAVGPQRSVTSRGAIIRDKRPTASADRPYAGRLAVPDPISGFVPCPVSPFTGCANSFSPF